MLKPEKEEIVEMWGNSNLMALETAFEWTSVRGQCVVPKPVSGQVSRKHSIHQGILERWNADARAAPPRRRSDAISSTFRMQRRVGRNLKGKSTSRLHYNICRLGRSSSSLSFGRLPMIGPRFHGVASPAGELQ